MKVLPIMDLKDISAIKRNLADKPMQMLAFVLGINSALRPGDLLSIKVASVRGQTIGHRVAIKESKTGKSNIFIITEVIKKALDDYFNSRELLDDHYLFKSRVGKNNHWTTCRLHKLVKQWTSDINLTGVYGSVTLRKTWAYHQRVTYGVPIEIISNRLRHSTTAITRAYISIQLDEVESVLRDNAL